MSSNTNLDQLARTIAARLAARGEPITAAEALERAQAAHEQLETLQEQLATQPRGYLHPTEGWVAGGWPD